MFQIRLKNFMRYWQHIASFEPLIQRPSQRTYLKLSKFKRMNTSHPRRLVLVLVISVWALDAHTVTAKQDKHPDFGPFLTYSVSQATADVEVKGKKVTPPRVGIADKGICIDVGNNATVCFDTDTMRMAAGWTGGFLDLHRCNISGPKGSGDATPPGPVAFSTPDAPGWAKDGSFADPRKDGRGPLPKDWAHYRGLYRHGQSVVLAYSVGKDTVLESPWSTTTQGQTLFVRTIHLDQVANPLSLYVAQKTSGVEAVGISLPAGASLRVVGDRYQLDLPVAKQSVDITVAIADGKNGVPEDAIVKAVHSSPAAPKAIADLCHGGPSLWSPPIVTKGRLAPQGKQPYVVDTIGLPFDHPGHTGFRPTGFDFFPDGRVAVCTFTGDVWIATGIDDKLDKITWRRFASGLYEPLGLKIVDGQLYVLGRDQITRLHDLDGDSEADFYENFNNDQVVDPAYHAFAFDLQADSKGNFWYTVDGNGVKNSVPMHACVVKVSKYGDKAEVIATGLRAANGTGMGPNDEFTCADNQGNWTPSSRINLVKPGGMYGYPGDPRWMTKDEIANSKTYDVPLCWIPYEYDNSSGGQAFVTSDKWGPLKGNMVHTSYGKCKLFEVMWEESEGMIQGATVQFPLNFESGIMRARFSPIDGQLYVCGLVGWQTAASREGCLQRVRYTGKPVCLPSNFKVESDGISIGFTCPLDPKTANDEQSFGIEQYNYRWSSKYGSSKYKVSNPKVVGTDEVEIKSAKLMEDGKTVRLVIPKLAPVMQMAIKMQLNAADGTPIECELDATINHVPGSKAPPVLTSP
jgi:hypothetical protein